MLTAERSPILQCLFNRYVMRLLRRRFHSVPLRAALQATLGCVEERHAAGEWKDAIDLIPPRGE